VIGTLVWALAAVDVAQYRGDKDGELAALYRAMRIAEEVQPRGRVEERSLVEVRDAIRLALDRVGAGWPTWNGETV
jgi:hypothetical protein